MAYYDTIYAVKGDTLPEVQLTLRDSNTAAEGQTLDPDDETTWAPIDLTGATVRVKLRLLGEDTLAANLTAVRVEPFTNGKAFFQFQDAGASVLTEEGVYEGEIEITYSNGGIHTIYDMLRLNVRDDF